MFSQVFGVLHACSGWLCAACIWCSVVTKSTVAGTFWWELACHELSASMLLCDSFCGVMRVVSPSLTVFGLFLVGHPREYIELLLLKTCIALFT
jgi:hypothetical protein